MSSTSLATSPATAPARLGAEPSDAEVVDALVRLVAIPSTSTHEAAAAEELVRVARAWGLDAHVDAAGNPQAWTPVLDATGPPYALAPATVLLLGHIDTVPGGPPPGLIDDAVWGRGSVDAKGPLVAMLAAAARHAGASGRTGGPLLRVGVIGATEEETPSSAGAVWVRDNLAPPDALVVGEPSGSDSVTLGYKGKVDLSCSVETSARHPAHPGDQAGEVLVDFCATLLASHRSQGNLGFDATALALTSVHADRARATCELSFRTPPGTDLQELVAWVRDQDPRVEVELLNAVGAVRVHRSDVVVGALSAAIAQEGRRARHQVKTGTSDMNTLAEAWQVPMATYGPGDAALDHTDDEHLPVDELLRGVRVLEHALGILAERLPAPAAGARR